MSPESSSLGINLRVMEPRKREVDIALNRFRQDSLLLLD